MPRSTVDPDELAFKAMTVLDDYFNTPAKSRDIDASRAARIASSYLSTWATLKQTANAAEGLRVMVARELAGENAEKFKRALMSPHVKQLDSGRRAR